MSLEEPSHSPKTFSHWVGVFISGLCMGAADIVPGISGGTVAFILGVYPELLSSLNSFNIDAFKKLLKGECVSFFTSVQWRFLLALVSGIVVSLITLAQFFSDILAHETYRVYLYSGFMGLILASIWYCARQLTVWRSVYLVALLGGALSAYLLTSAVLQPNAQETVYNVDIGEQDLSQTVVNYQDQHLLNVPVTTLSAMLSKGIIQPETQVTKVGSNIQVRADQVALTHFSPSLDLWIICCGAIAISAMLLPGISGSYLLTILGVYGLVIAALADFVRGAKAGIFEMEAFLILASMSIGVVLGAIIFSRVVSWMLSNYHNATIATLTGFMIGAMGSVWPFWTYQYSLLPLKLDKGPQLEVVQPIFPDVSSPLFLKACAFAIAGFALVLVLERVANKGKQPGLTA